MYRLFLAPRTPQNQDMQKLKLRLSLAEVGSTSFLVLTLRQIDRAIYNAIVAMKVDLTLDAGSGENPRAQLSDGLIYFEVI